MGDEETIEDIEETPEEEESLEGMGQRKKLLGPTVVRTLIFVALALVLIIVSGTVAFLISRKAGAPPATEKISPEFVEKENPLAYFDMESFSINTSDTDEPHFLKLTLSLGYDMGKVDLQTELVQRKAQLRDIIISIRQYSQELCRRDSHIEIRIIIENDKRRKTDVDIHLPRSLGERGRRKTHENADRHR